MEINDDLLELTDMDLRIVLTKYIEFLDKLRQETANACCVKGISTGTIDDLNRIDESYRLVAEHLEDLLYERKAFKPGYPKETSS